MIKMDFERFRKKSKLLRYILHRFIIITRHISLNKITVLFVFDVYQLSLYILCWFMLHFFKEILSKNLISKIERIELSNNSSKNCFLRSSYLLRNYSKSCLFVRVRIFCQWIFFLTFFLPFDPKTWWIQSKEENKNHRV